MSIHSFTETHLYQISVILQGAVTHPELTNVFRQLDINEPVPAEGLGSKQKRMLRTLSSRQKRDGCGNNVGKFIETVLDPALFTNNGPAFTELRARMNVILAFSGMQLLPSGRLVAAEPARSLSEAHERAGKLRAELTEARS